MYLWIVFYLNESYVSFQTFLNIYIYIYAYYQVGMGGQINKVI